MKKTVEVEQTFCDICGGIASGYDTCMRCGKDFCYEHSKTELKNYPHAIYFSGSGDGRYCHECDKLLCGPDGFGDKKHAAYRKIEQLKNELIGWSSDFKRRSEAAENELKKIQEA